MADETKPGESGEAKAEPPKPIPPAAKPAAAKPAAPKPPAVMVTTPWSDEFTERVKAQFPDATIEFAAYLGQKFLLTKWESVPALVDYLKEEEQFDYLVDITAVDWPKREARFDLVYILYSFARNERIRIKAQVKEGDKPQSVVDIHRTADWLEREVFDMFGIEFANHPGLKRILMPDEWEGHPLRKDYNILQMDNRWVRENAGIESGQ